jgi:hypothetical protein
MTGSFKLKEISPTVLGAIQAALNLGTQFNLGFGGEGRSAFIENNTFAAIEGQDVSSVSEKYLGTRRGPFGSPIPQTQTYVDNNPSVQGFVVSADAIAANEVLFPGQKVQTENGEEQKRAFCQSCDFIKWGAWGARVDYTQHGGQAATADIPLGWWIAGDVVSSSDMPTTGSASYMGDAIGNVINSGKQYTATGDMSMIWYFGPRSGTLTISDFDNKTFSGRMDAPGRLAANVFSGALVGSDHLVGAANGAFVGSPGPGITPQGVIGNFGVANSTWQATGIFGGTAVPHGN